MPKYHPRPIEAKWQQYWEDHQVFVSPRLPGGPKRYVLDMFPYPSGDGLHVGHPEGYTATDIVCRFARMRGQSVMHPMGFDSFGLPAEEHAIKTNTHPRIQTEANIATFRRQLKMLGFSYDWSRELATTDRDYVRWTQWIFLQLYDTWFDASAQRGRPIAELPIPDAIRQQGEEAIRRYQDEHRLAYQAEARVNWCPALGTVLANEEVTDGKSERGGHAVERLPLRQWMLRITAYADRLERDLEPLDWPESIKILQRNWIGRSVGAEVDFFLGTERECDLWKSQRNAEGFPSRHDPHAIRIFTTRPDTLFGATYMVLAPEHPLVPSLCTSDQRPFVEAYQGEAAGKSDLERTELSKKKTGVFTGGFARNPVNGQPIPIWIADYVLASYGTGAIMAVPAHDERDFEFAQAFGLPVIPVIDPGAQAGDVRTQVLAGTRCAVTEGTLINSGAYNGIASERVKTQITSDLARQGLGKEAVNYKLRDWLFSRQRFWGEPFPILHELDEQGRVSGLHRAVALHELPVELPELDDFRPHGRPEPLLDKAPPSWLYPVIDGRRYKRETNTMPQWAGSCWYYLRFLDPHNANELVAPDVERAWMPVDLYVGGAEHAVLHLLYARFWHKVLFDRGMVSSPEPFQKLVNQGMILGEIEITGYTTSDGAWVSSELVTTNAESPLCDVRTGQAVLPHSVSPDATEKIGDQLVLKEDHSIRLDSRAYKMSKSRGNVVNPDQIVREYGADALRLYEMFMGPLEATKPWSTRGVSGVSNFLGRAWRMIVDEHAETGLLHEAVQPIELTADQSRMLHRTIAAVTKDTEQMAFNTAIARLMEFVNYFTKESTRPQVAMESFALLVSPYAPHLGEELWQILGHRESLAYETWPTYDPAWLRDAELEVPVQIRGKVRARVRVPADADAAATEQAARAEPRIVELLQGQTLVKTIVIPGKLVNFVTK